MSMWLMFFSLAYADGQPFDHYGGNLRELHGDCRPILFGLLSSYVDHYTFVCLATLCGCLMTVYFWRTSWIAACRAAAAEGRFEGLSSGDVRAERREIRLFDALAHRPDHRPGPRWCTCGVLIGEEPVRMLPPFAFNGQAVCFSPGDLDFWPYSSECSANHDDESELHECIDEWDFAPPPELISDDVNAEHPLPGQDHWNSHFGLLLVIGITTCAFWLSILMARAVSFIMSPSTLERRCRSRTARARAAAAAAPCKKARPPGRSAVNQCDATASVVSPREPSLRPGPCRKMRPRPGHGHDGTIPPGLLGNYFGPEGMFFAVATDEAWLDALEQGPLKAYHPVKRAAAAAASLFSAPGGNRNIGFAFGPVLEC